MDWSSIDWTKDEKEIKRQENLYVKLPLLVREILLDSALPLFMPESYVEITINEIKRITNAECESALEYLKKNYHLSKS